MSRPSNWEPLAPSDPTPGDPHEIRQLARQMAETAQAINDAVAALNKIHDSTTVWESDAGREFKTRTRETADTIKKAYTRYDEVSDALYAYARDLGPVQDDADDLLFKVQCAQDDADSAQKKAGSADPDTQEKCDADAISAGKDLDDLKAKLEPIVTEWDRIGNVAAEAIKEIIEGDDLKDSRWDDFKGFVSDLTDLAGLLSAFFGVLALICSVIPGLQPFAAVFGALALIAGLLSLLGNLFLMSQGMATLEDVLWDVAGVVTFGAGRAFTMAARNSLKAAKGLSKPALIRSLRQAGHTKRQARDIARARQINGGDATTKALGRGFNRGEVTWRPNGRDVYDSFRHPLRDVARGGHGLPADVAGLPGVRTAIRNSEIASGVASGAGAVSTTGDLDEIGLGDLAERGVDADIPGVGGGYGPLTR